MFYSYRRRPVSSATMSQCYGHPPDFGKSASRLSISLKSLCASFVRGSSSNIYILYLLDVVIKEKPDDNLLGVDNISSFFPFQTHGHRVSQILPATKYFFQILHRKLLRWGTYSGRIGKGRGFPQASQGRNLQDPACFHPKR